ncbi:hypothetical protein [Desulfoplanes formicivorans]|uniref:Uncharacterized protein n=1 Tax=Desulfoplanes formicivorans TaxID=1592317 RepID=A0A194AH94_9BACT|nr:hypothetical protein [Desulfoplanes formicivorans]GAU09452.1 hypothetical protein DPF_2178 [Desulfoplanes formicivorans]
MAQSLPFNPEPDFRDEVKTLGNDELLDCWEQTQFVDTFMEGEPMDQVRTTVYEQVILQELQLRRYRQPRKAL